MLSGLVQILCCKDPNVGVMTEHKQTLLGCEHDTSRNKCSVFAAKRILLLEVDELTPQLDLENVSSSQAIKLI